jgi:hypothetical protein
MLKNLILSLFLVVLIVAPARAGDWRVDNVDRVVAISDVHGAYDAMVETLRNVDILDDKLSWAGGTSHLVIVGDLLDRGPRSRAAMDLLMRLEVEAQSAGGRVHVLIGNHESMNMIGDLRYVSKEEYAAFAGEETPEMRERWLAAWAERNNSDAETVRSRFDSTFPAGYFALRSALSAEGKYGKWLLSKNVVAVINGTAFVHGGLPREPQARDGRLRARGRYAYRSGGSATDRQLLRPRVDRKQLRAIAECYARSYRRRGNSKKAR